MTKSVKYATIEKKIILKNKDTIRLWFYSREVCNMDGNYTFEVFEKIIPENREKWMLYIDAIYKADSTKKNTSGEVLSKLLGVKNQGGFRYKGNTKTPNFVMLFTSGEDVYWRDELDTSLGLLLYYGDNKTPGNDLHNTNLHGNEILKYIFDLAVCEDIELRKKLPPIFVFKKAKGRDVMFLGLAVPGIIGRPNKEWLTAVWGCNREGQRFQNYKAYFTILNTTSGSEFNSGFGISLAWLNDIENGQAYSSKYAPYEWKKYVDRKKYSPLLARQEKFVRTKQEQLPDDILRMSMLNMIHNYFIEKDRGYGFEQFAANITQYIDKSVVDISVTRPYKDGGFDAEGRYKIFSNVENVIYVDFYLQAKCYNPQNNGITVKDTARLVSRIKNRQFGVLVTTSFITTQAYQEILDDQHPIVFITGKDIVNYIFDELEIRDLSKLDNWLKANY